MLERCKTQEQALREIAFVEGSGFAKTSPYVYLNLLRYEAGNDDVRSWALASGDGEIDAVYLMYYDCLHALIPGGSHEEFGALAALVDSEAPRTVMVSGLPEEAAVPGFEDGWAEDHNYVIDMDGVGTSSREYKSVLAEDEDMEAIADLMVADSHYSGVYDRDTLVRQMRDRLRGSFSRYYIIRDGDAVAAACSTYGEWEGFAMIGGVIVGPDHRRRGYASDIEGHICRALEDDGMSRVGFVSTANAQSLALHEKLGSVKIGMIHKFVRNAG